MNGDSNGLNGRSNENILTIKVHLIVFPGNNLVINDHSLSCLYVIYYSITYLLY